LLAFLRAPLYIWLRKKFDPTLQKGAVTGAVSSAR